ncbi:MAG: hypothetical protein HGB26_09270 [Desulfobulbaceae bacterium]|nr:hypothetical protein [Desulfobulbaceae bacterium]
MNIGIDGGALSVTDDRLKVGVYRVGYQLIKELQKRGKRVVVLLIPYHPAVYKDKLMSDALNEVRQRVNRLEVEEGIHLKGSYNPTDFGCTANEFFDDMHPKDSCLEKLSTPH